MVMFMVVFVDIIISHEALSWYTQHDSSSSFSSVVFGRRLFCTYVAPLPVPLPPSFRHVFKFHQQHLLFLFFFFFFYFCATRRGFHKKLLPCHSISRSEFKEFFYILLFRAQFLVN